MTHRIYSIRWYATGDIDLGLSQGEVHKEAAGNDCKWVDGYIVDQSGIKVGIVYRHDD